MENFLLYSEDDCINTINYLCRNVASNMFYTLCGDKVSVNPYIPTQTMKEIKATICNHQADSPPYVACGLIWWFANLERYGHTWDRMSLLRLGVIKQSQPKLNMYERTHQFARYNCRIWRWMSFLKPGVVKQHKTPNSNLHGCIVLSERAIVILFNCLPLGGTANKKQLTPAFDITPPS